MAAVPTLIAEIDFQGNPTATYADIQTTGDGVQGFWRCNSSSTFLDERGLNDGTVSGSPSLIAGPYSLDADQGLSFDGTNDFALVPDSPTLANAGAFTIMGWLRFASLPGAQSDIVSKPGSWHVALNTAGKVVFFVKNDTATATVTSNTGFSTGTWYHVACVYDTAAISIYINGILDVTGAYTSGIGLAGHALRFAHENYTSGPGVPTVTQGEGTGTGLTVTKPSGTADGDLLLVHIVGGVAAPTVVPTGWEIQDAGTIGASVKFVGLYSKIAASEPASWVWTFASGTRYVWCAVRVTGHSGATWKANPIYSTTTGAGTSFPTGTHLGNFNNIAIFGFVGDADNSGVDTTHTWSSGSAIIDNSTISAGDTAAQGATVVSQAAPSALNLTATTSQSVLGGRATWLAVSGDGSTFRTCQIKDWSYTSRGASASEIAALYFSKDSGEGTYTVVTPNVRSFSSSGPQRQYELARMEASTSSVALRDFTHDFDPGDTTSIYSPNVIPVRRLKLRATWNSTTYPLLKEFIERWPPQGGEAVDYQEIAVTSVDGFDLLSHALVTGSLETGFSGTQINSLLDKAFWPVTARAIDTGQYVMSGFALDSGATALGTIQEIADSERGIFFIDESGIATFHDAAYRGSETRATTSQATFADDTSGSAIVYQELTPSADKDRIINDWVVTPDSTVFGSAAQRVTDWASVAKYGLRSQTRSTRLASNASALEQAGNLLNETAGFGLRFDSMVVIPTTTAGYDECLDLGVSDRVTVKRGVSAGWTGQLIERDCFIEGKALTVSDSRAPWRFTFSLSPVSLGNYFATIMRDEPISYWRMVPSI